MNKHSDTGSLRQGSDTLHSMAESSDAAAGILSGATQDLFEILSTLGATEIAESLSRSCWVFAPGGPDYQLSKMPALWQSQFEHTVKAVLDSAAVLLRAQHQLLEWEVQSLSKHFGAWVSTADAGTGGTPVRRLHQPAKSVALGK